MHLHNEDKPIIEVVAIDGQILSKWLDGQEIAECGSTRYSATSLSV
ncbi:hypothetical protein ACKFKF_24995 [Phormidesmis sp. 146-12]